MKRLLAVITLCFLATPGWTQTDLSGVWLLQFTNPDGTVRKTFLKLSQQGGKISGTATLNYRLVPITEGTLEGSKFHLLLGQNNRRLTLDGTIEGDHLIIEQKSADGRINNHGEARRSDAAAMSPPKPIPLPALHNVPDNGLGRTPPMGWNSWNRFRSAVDDKTVREIADTITANGMKAAGYQYINIDDTWQLGRDKNGNITTNKKFPNMKALADYVHSKGLKIGIYSSPGPATCAGYEGSLGHEQADANTYAKWGFDYLKYDWCSASAVYGDKDMQQVYQVMGDALRATGRPIVYSLCQYGKQDVWLWGAKVSGNLWRTTGDISDNWKSMSTIGFKQLAIAPYAIVGHWNDPDMLEIGNGGMTDEEYRTHMTLWAMLRAPLLAGNDIRSMSEQTKAILLNRDVIAIDQDLRGEPAQLAKEDGQVEIWTRRLDDDGIALAFFNKGGQAAGTSISWTQAHMKMPKKARNLWTHQEVNVAVPRFRANIPAHGTVLLKLLPN